MKALSKFFFLSLISYLTLAPAFSSQSPLFTHGLDLYNQLKYPPNFKNFDYANPAAPKGGEIKLAQIGTFDSLNPFVIKGVPAAGISQLHPSYLYATLLAHSYDEPNASYGYIAESMELAPDRSWVIFNLRKEATFHDGSIITPEDVIFTFNILKSKGQPLFKAYYRDITKVEKIAERQVKFSFASGKNLELPVIIGEMPILSKAYYSKNNFEAASLTIPLGNGPYKIEAVEAGESITFRRVKNWWGENIPVNKGRYNYDTIKYIYFRDTTIAFEAFKAGAYDLHLESSSKNWATGYDIPFIKEGKIVKKAIKNSLNQGMQGFFFNTRRDLFQDVRVRQALGLLFDFEWTNKNLFYGLYKRTNSYFANSELAAQGLPSGEELKILEPFRSQLPPELFTTPFQMPITDGLGYIRTQLEQALKLMQQAGWEITQQTMTHGKTKQPFAFEILIVQPEFTRVLQGFVNNLKRLGIQATIRLVDSTQYEARVNNFDFDMIMALVPQSESPGNEQMEFWGSKAATAKGSRNYAGIIDPIIDHLIQLVLNAASRESLVQRTRALDRVLLWHYYTIPLWHSNEYRLAYWNKFKQPPILPKYALPVDYWWIDPSLEKQLLQKTK